MCGGYRHPLPLPDTDAGLSMKAAQINRDWVGETVAIFASGPSMSPAIAEAVRGTCRTIAINNQSFDCAPWADVIWGSDRKWWVQYFDQVKDLPGRKIMVKQGQELDGVEFLEIGGSPYDERPGYISTGGNSGYAALCFAARAGATRINLYGYDMREVHGKARRFEYPKSMNAKPRFRHWLANFDRLAPELKRRGVDVVNCAHGSALRCFRFEQQSKAVA